jgi:hypothetical protein
MGAAPPPNHEELAICRDVGGEYERLLYLCNDCIAESWARATSHRDRRSAEEMEKEAEERERKRVGEVFLNMIRTNPEAREVLRAISRGDPVASVEVVETERRGPMELFAERTADKIVEGLLKDYEIRPRAASRSGSQ